MVWKKLLQLVRLVKSSTDSGIFYKDIEALKEAG